MSKIDKLLKYIAILIYCFLSFIMGIFSYNSEFVREIFSAIEVNRAELLYGDYTKDTKKDFTCGMMMMLENMTSYY